MKKALAFLLVSAIFLGVLSLLPTSVRAAEVVESGTITDTLTWTLYDDGVLVISGEGEIPDNWYETDLEGTSYLLNRGTTIIIEEGVTAIGRRAFYDNRELKSVTIPASVKTISLYAFPHRATLEAFHVDPASESFCAVDGNLFSKDMQKLYFCVPAKTGTYAIPDGVTSICSDAFLGCTGLTTISIPDSVTDISYSTFSDCAGLETFLIGESNNSYCVQDDILYTKDMQTLICCPKAKSGDYTIPDGVTTIGLYAFSGCDSLTGITIPASVTDIRDEAFSYCDNLRTVTFCGDKPDIREYEGGDGLGSFYDVEAIAYYPAGNTTWTTWMEKYGSLEDVTDLSYCHGGRLTWTPYDASHTHSYTAAVTAPTCTEVGSTTYTCECGDSYVEAIPATGHSFGQWSQVPDKDGYQQRACTVCHHIEEKAENLPETGDVFAFAVLLSMVSLLGLAALGKKKYC